MDRNVFGFGAKLVHSLSLSARRAWIEMPKIGLMLVVSLSLSARRAWIEMTCGGGRNEQPRVALRKESVDRNVVGDVMGKGLAESLSARRAWIEM